MKKLKAFLLSLILIIPFVMTGCFNSSDDKMAMPSELTITSGVIRFARVDNDDYYVLNIDGVNLNIFPNQKTADSEYNYVSLYTVNGVNYLEYDASRLFNIGESYVIKLKACGIDKVDSDYTAPYSYTYSPAMATPSNLSITGSTLTWSAVEDAGLYVVKVITPSDSVSADDAESVQNNDYLSSYQFTKNSFDFSSILSIAGEYKFYVSAISADNARNSSDFSSKVSYKHIVKLDTPKLGSVQLASDNTLHMIAVIDDNANAVKLTANDQEILLNLNTATLTAVNSVSNLYDLNLTEIFSDIDFNELTQYSFTARAISISSGTNYYTDSEVSNASIYEKTAKLDSPTLEINNGIVNWTNLNSLSTGIRLYVFRETVETYEILNGVSNFVLPNDYIAVGARAIGAGNYLDSDMSELLSNNTNEINDFDISTLGQIISWTNVPNAQYVVEIGNEFYIQSENSFDITTIKYPISSIKVTAVSDSFAPTSVTATISNYTIKLATPTISFSSQSNPYLLQISPVNNALAYKVYLTDGQGVITEISNVFTSTQIDLSLYVIRKGEYREYEVQVQALADTLSIYRDSALSNSLSIIHTPALDKPEFASGENGITPITYDIVTNKYYLNFYGVNGASSYDIAINGQHLLPIKDTGDEMYHIDITAYIPGANRYTITLQALPSSNNGTVLESEINSYIYEKSLQLSEVTDITVSENDGRYTLSFALQDQAYSYQVRILKLNDSGYAEYLESLGLSNVFEVYGSSEITDYVEQAGEYRIYVTALAREGSLYVSSVESSTYAVIDKLDTLSTPVFDSYNDRESGLTITWTGDNNAEYFIVRITDPSGHIYERRTYDSITRTLDITDIISEEGDYSVSIKAMIASDNPSYISSPFSDEVSFNYLYMYSYDFDRYSVFMNGKEYSHSIANVYELTNVLWYYYLFGIDELYNLDLYLELNEEETIRDATIRLANEADSNEIYNFATDEEWATLLEESTDTVLFGYLCKVLINLYPEMAILDNESFTVNQTAIYDGYKFELYYENLFNVEKQDTNQAFITIANDYANDYKYLDKYMRRSGNVIFAIDSKQEMEVSTTEQLLMAVQYGKKPVFVGDSEVSELVYNNAKAVLLACVSDSMSDLEKVQAIYDWLIYAYNYNLDAKNIFNSANVEVEGSLLDYGNRKEFYLEGIFLGLRDNSYGGFDGEFYLGNKNATEQSFSKAFVLLCSIEGIESRKVNGTLSYTSNDQPITIAHSWNKVYVDTSSDNQGKNWYNVDITYSDYHPIINVNSGSLSASYNMASHLFYLVSDEFLSSNMRFSYSNDSMTGSINVSVKENVNPVASEIIPFITNSYDYYVNATFSMTRNDLLSTLYNRNVDYRNDKPWPSLVTSEAGDFKYSLKFINSNTYQRYNMIGGYGELQAFVFNALTYAKFNLINNENKMASFEIRLNNEDIGGTGSWPISNITTIVNAMNNYFRQTKDVDNVAETNLAVNSYQVYDSSTNSTMIIFTMQFTN